MLTFCTALFLRLYIIAGVKVVAECMSMSTTNHTQEKARALIESLSHGNPKYQDQVYKSLVDLMSSMSPKTQQLLQQALRALQVYGMDLKLNFETICYMKHPKTS